ncbi:MAG TPA: hypothetical protein DCP25_12295 [Chloroflexi bacterium]|jgi:hypothetical protein|nr:hypothetical protein [Chloroflexota bacterium]
MTSFVNWRSAAALAWAALGFELLVVVVGAIVKAFGPATPFELDTQLVNVFALSIVAFGLLGALIVTRHPENRLGWVFTAIAFVHSLGYLAAVLAGYLVFRGPTPEPAGVMLAWLFIWSANLHYAPSGTFVFLLFPDGHLPSRRWRAVVWLTLASTAGLAVATATLPGPLVVFANVQNPFGVEGPVPLALAGVSFLIAGGCGVASVASLFVRYRRAAGPERQQIKWYLYGGAIASATFVVIIGFGVPLTSATYLVSGATIVIAAAAAVAIFRYHLYDIDLLINRTLVYGLTTGGLALAFFALVVALQTLLRPFTGGSEIAVAGSTLGSVALFQPLRQRAQAGVDRRFYRSRYDAGRTVDDFSVRLRDEVDLEALRAGLLDAVSETMRPTHASLWLRETRNDSRTLGG